MCKTGLLLVLAVAACGKKDDSKPAPTGGAPASAPAASDKVDVCAMVSKADVETVLGEKVTDGPKTKDNPNVLSECLWATDTQSAAVSAASLDGFDGNVKAHADAKDVPGLGESAKLTPGALLVKPAGKPYYLIVIAGPAGTMDPAKSQALAKAIIH